jgi:predicted DNA-binding transcriptional regulator AlpA
MQYVAERLNVSKRTIKNMVKDGRLNPPIGKLGKSPVWHKRTIDTFINLGKHLTK